MINIGGSNSFNYFKVFELILTKIYLYLYFNTRLWLKEIKEGNVKTF